jgi:hypothetical protein
MYMLNMVSACAPVKVRNGIGQSFSARRVDK